MKIAVCRLERLGDIIACEPIARHLRSQPDTKVHWYVSPDYRTALDGNESVDEVHELACLCEWLEVRASKAYDRTVGLHFLGDGCPKHGRRLRALDIDGNPLVTFQNYYLHRNLLEAYCRVGGIPTSVAAQGPRFVVRDLEAWPVWPSEPYVVFHGETHDGVRDWVPGKWHSLRTRIESEWGLGVIEVSRGRGPARILAEVLVRAKAFIGVDSGPAQMANALGVPGVVLLSRYLWFPHTYQPYSGGYEDGSRAVLVRDQESVKEIEVETVLAALGERLSRDRPARVGVTG